jgi:outer membrane protein TolC
LFSGFRIKYGVESARFLEQAAKLDAENDREDIVQNTINAYSNLYKASMALNIVKENLATQKQRVADFGNLEKNGLLARNDMLKAQLQQSNIELSVLDAENNLKMASVNMDLMLGLDDNTDLQPDSVVFKKAPEVGSILQWEQTALHNRKDVEALSYREKAAISGIMATKGEYYPGIALTGGTIAADIPNVLRITNALNVGLGLQYNVGALWKTGAKVNEAKARLHQVQATESLVADQIRVQINQAYHNYLLSTRRIDVYGKAVEQANENYRITKNKFDNNLATTTDLLDADAARLQAQLNYTMSKADAVTAYTRLQQTAGVLSK